MIHPVWLNEPKDDVALQIYIFLLYTKPIVTMLYDTEVL